MFSGAPGRLHGIGGEAAGHQGLGQEAGHHQVLAIRGPPGQDQGPVQAVEAQGDGAVGVVEFLRDDLALAAGVRGLPLEELADALDDPLGLGAGPRAVARRGRPHRGEDRLHRRPAVALGAEGHAALDLMVSPLWLPPWRSPRTPFSVTPSKVARAATLRESQEEKSRSRSKASTAL